MTRPSPIPAPDRHQIENLNTLCTLEDNAEAQPGWRHWLVGPLRRWLFRTLHRQERFNSAVVDHLNRNAKVGLDAHHATDAIIDWAERSFRLFAEQEMSADDLRRHREALVARERRATTAVDALVAKHEELRASLSVLQRATQSLKRAVDRLGVVPVGSALRTGDAAAASGSTDPIGIGITSGIEIETPAVTSSNDSYKYLGFEDQFRGSQDEIRGRLQEYLPIFAGASDVLDLGCGRGEFLALLREQGTTARGLDTNRAMVDTCRDRGLDAAEGDGLTYLRSLPNGSLGGLIATQVVEHLEPRYLSDLLDAAFDKLRPGSAIVLETINPACWVAFFESYIRDITHVQPIHPETLKYLLVASGFGQVDLRFLAPYPEADKLQALTRPADTTLADWAETINANVDKINRLLFTWLDYAAIGHRP
jgi:O-antigen chain-terminating methyltransferase